MNRTFNESYIAGFADGDASICIGKCNGGFQLKVELSQCNLEFLQHINEYFNNEGKLYTDSRTAKYTKEQASALRFCGQKALPFLQLMKNKAVIKAQQATLAIEYLALINIKDAYEQKLTFYQRMKQLNNDKTAYDKDYERINDAYIAGLFDAEGNVYKTDYPKFKCYVKITQKSDPLLLENIQRYLGFGNISSSENYRLRFFSKNNILMFHKIVSLYCTVKKHSLETLVQALNSR